VRFDFEPETPKVTQSNRPLTESKSEEIHNGSHDTEGQVSPDDEAAEPIPEATTALRLAMDILGSDDIERGKVLSNTTSKQSKLVYKNVLQVSVA
jgi:hypothetical protein